MKGIMSKKKPDDKPAVVTTPPVSPEVRPTKILHDSKLYEWYEGPLFNAHLPIMPAIPSASPELYWKGAGIPWDVYCQLTSFMYWSYEETKGESQARLAYNTETHDWHIIIMPQERSTGLTTKELETHPDRNAAQAVLRTPNVVTAGTAHHHCALSAFQSGTDKADEDRQDGLHITFGKLDEKALDTHARVVLRGHTYATSLEKWINFPIIPAMIPVSMHETLRKHWLTHPERVPFPAEWKTRLIRPAPVVTSSVGGNSYKGNYSGGSAASYFVSSSSYVAPVEEAEIDTIKASDAFIVEAAQRIVDEATTITEARARIDVLRSMIFPMWQKAVREQNADVAATMGGYG